MSFHFHNIPWPVSTTLSTSISTYLTRDVVDLTQSNVPSDASEDDADSAYDPPLHPSPAKATSPRIFAHRPRVSAASRSQSRSSSAALESALNDTGVPTSTLQEVDEESKNSTPSWQVANRISNSSTATRPISGRKSNSSTPSPSSTGARSGRSTPSRQSAAKRPDDLLENAGPSPRSSPLQRKRDSSRRSKTVSPALNARSGDKMDVSDDQHSETPHRSSPRRPPPTASVAPSSIVQTTPRQQHTPRKLDWTTEKLAGKLRELAQDLEEQHNIMIYRMIGENAKAVKERRVFDGEDLFANVKMPPIPEDKSLTARIKFKPHSNGRRNINSSAGRRTETLPVIPLKTTMDRVPPYRFHHIEINKNILTPQTRLDYIPHIKDVSESEETRYNRWLQELEEMEAASGFETLSREQRAAKTRCDECTARLAVVLPAWLKALSIDGCTKNTLIRYMATQAQTNTITPQQKTSILDSCGRDDQIGSPRATAAAKLFTEAFDQVFYTEHADFASVTLRDVLFRDESVDNIIDPKRSTAKEVTATPKPAEMFSVEKPLLEQTYLETYFVFGCLICFSNSCEHGEYDAKNQKRTFSMEAWGGVDGALKRRALRSAENGETPEEKALYAEPCSDKCFRAVGDSFPGHETSWDPNELRSLRVLVETSLTGPSFRPPECNAAGFLGRPCWAVRRKVQQLGISPRVIRPPTPPATLKSLPWYDRSKKMLLGDWQEHVKIHDHARRDIVEPCSHDGPCSVEAGCSCVKAGVLCERFCRCTAKTCPYKFTGCACHSLGKLCYAKQKERPCICVQLNRECDPGLCHGCGAADRADPVNRHDDELHETGCQNCALQRGKSKQVVLGRSLLNGCGYGLVTAEDIAQDEFVIEYVGELIVQDEGVRREARRGDDVFCDQKAPSYVFSLLEDEGTWVDGAVYGNLSRYINHAPEGNLTPKVLYVNHEYRIRFTALRDIKAGEELFFNYGDNFPNLTQKLLEDRVDEDQCDAARGTRKRGRRPGPRRGRGQGSRGGRARVQGGRKTAPPETTEWDFVDAEPAQKRRRTRVDRYHDEEEDEEDEGEEDEEEYQPGNAEWGEGSDWEFTGRRRGGRGGRGARGAAGRRARRSSKKWAQARRVNPKVGSKVSAEVDANVSAKAGAETSGDKGVNEDDSDAILYETPSKKPRKRGARRGGLRSNAHEVPISDGSNSEAESSMVRHRRARKRPRVVNDSADETETRDEVMVVAEGVLVREREGGGEELEEDEDEAAVRGRSSRKAQMPARFRNDEQGESE